MDHSTDKKSWATQVVDMYSEGCSDAEVAASLRVPIREYYKQIEDNPTFKQLVEYGRTLSQAFWEKQARKNIGNKQFNTPLWVFYMKNKFAWAEKTENVNVDENINIDLDQLREKVYKDVAELIKLQTPELTDAQRVLKAVNE